MNQIALFTFAALYLFWKAYQGEQQNKRVETPEPSRWLVDVRAVEALKAQGWLPIEQHEQIIGGPMGTEWWN